MFVRYRGKTKLMWFKKNDTAREIRAGGLVQLQADSGASVAPPRNDSTDRVIGVSRVNDTVTDTAYNVDNVNPTPGMVPVEVPVENAVEWLIDTDSDGGAADTDIGHYCAIDTTGGNSVNAGDSGGMRVDISDTTQRQIFITGRISATRIIGVIAKSGFNGHITDDTTGV